MIKIIEGDNPFLSKQRLNIIIEEYKKENPDSNCKIINADSTSISQIINEYETQDIFSFQKLIILKRLLSNKSHKDLLEILFLKAETNTGIDLVVWEEKNIPKNTKYYKFFNNAKLIESFPKFNKRSFQKWSKEQIDFSLDDNLLSQLIEMTNYDPYLFLNEIAKLKLSGKESFSQKDLEENTNDVYTSSIWEFIDAINEKGNRKKYTKILINLLKNGADSNYLMVMLARNIKQIMLINKMLVDSKEDKEIVSTLKIPPFTLPKLKSIAKKSSYENLLSIYEKIYNLNYQTKMGNIDPELGLILLATRLN